VFNVHTIIYCSCAIIVQDCMPLFQWIKMQILCVESCYYYWYFQNKSCINSLLWWYFVWYFIDFKCTCSKIRNVQLSLIAKRRSTVKRIFWKGLFRSMFIKRGWTQTNRLLLVKCLLMCFEHGWTVLMCKILSYLLFWTQVIRLIYSLFLLNTDGHCTHYITFIFFRQFGMCNW